MAGDPDARREAAWSVPGGDDLVKALPFLPWSAVTPSTRVQAPRSAFWSALLGATRLPEAAQMTALQTMMFISHEPTVAKATAYVVEELRGGRPLPRSTGMSILGLPQSRAS